jgi:hypothetical protein
MVAIDGALALIAVLLIVQMWLLSATLESFLGGHYAGVVPAAAVSVGSSVLCVVLSAFVRKAGRQDS